MFIWGQSRPEQARGKSEPWVCPFFRSTMGAPGSDVPQDPEDSCSTPRPPLTIGQRALSPQSPHFSSSKRDITALLLLSKACHTKPAPTIGLCACCSLCLICSSPDFYMLAPSCHLDLSSNVSSLLSHYLSYFLFNIYQYLKFLI